MLNDIIIQSICILFWGVYNMKKFLALIMICVLISTSVMCINANDLSYEEQGYEILFNSETTGYTSVIHNNIHYVPIRKVFEKMGASVFYSSADRQILALAGNGDIIQHVMEENILTVNGQKKVFNNPSIIINNESYIPIDMLSIAFWTDSVSYDNQQLNIQKQISDNAYIKSIREVLAVSKSSNFNPEKFHRYINYHVNMPSLSMQDVIFKVNVGLDYPFYENIITIGQPHELLVLVNKYNKLPAAFTQYNLVNMDRNYTVNDSKQYLLEGGAYEKYKQMADAAKKEGLSLKVISAYRTESYQAGLYNNKLRTTGKVNADNYSARPGHSEHQTGLAVDINTTSGTFEYTAEFRWLQNHAHEYGYILRYQKGKEWITGYAYEPWHYRYVGIDAAKVIYEEGITFEEYYAKYISSDRFR